VNKLSIITAMLLAIWASGCATTSTQPDQEAPRVSMTETEKRLAVLRKLAQGDQLRSFIKNSKVTETSNLLTYLAGFKPPLDASIIYLMDSSGNVVACTPFGDNQTITGKNYQFRPYFQKALAGEDCVYRAKGRTTGKHAVFLSTPLTVGDKSAKFVLVAKCDVIKE